MTSPDHAREADQDPDLLSLRLHPWNEGFSWVDHRAPGRTISTDQARAYDDEGFFVLEDVFDPDTIRAMRAEIAPHDAATNDLLRSIDGGRISVAAADALTVTPHLVVRSSMLRDLCGGSVLTGLAFDLIGPDVRLYWDQAVYKFPHNLDAVPWHQDNGYAYVEPQAYLTCWIPLVDTTSDNGCIRVMPGLHRRGTLEHWDTELGYRCLPDAVEGAVPVPARAGSVVVFSSLTPHATGPNVTDEVRPAYIVQYAPDGAVALRGDPNDPPAVREPLDHPRRQFSVLVDGRPGCAGRSGGADDNQA